MPINRNYLLAALLAITAFSLWVGYDVLIKLAGDTLSIPQRAAVGQLMAALTILLFEMGKRNNVLKQLHTTKPVFHLFRCGLAILNLMAGLYAVSNLPLANFYTIAFTAPFLITLMSLFLPHERLKPGVWAALVLGFVGVVIAVNPDAESAGSWPPLAVGSMFVSMLCFAISTTTIKWGGKNESCATLVFYPLLAVGLFSLCLMLFRGDLSFDLQGLSYALMGGIAYGLASLCLTEAFRRAKNGLIAPFHYTQIIGGSLLGYLIWGDVPTIQTIIGLTVIIGAGLYIIWHGSKDEQSTCC